MLSGSRLPDKVKNFCELAYDEGLYEADSRLEWYLSNPDRVMCACIYAPSIPVGVGIIGLSKTGNYEIFMHFKNKSDVAWYAAPMSKKLSIAFRGLK